MGQTHYHQDIIRIKVQIPNLASINTREQRTIYKVPEGYFKHIVSIGADGKYAYTSVIEDVTPRRKEATLQGTFDCHPHSQIMKIAIDGSGAE